MFVVFDVGIRVCGIIRLQVYILFTRNLLKITLICVDFYFTEETRKLFLIGIYSK